MPATHLAAAKLPAVSGSSGRLVISPVESHGSELHGPGRVFADPNLDYPAAMLAFVAASQGSETCAATATEAETTNLSETPSLKEAKRALQQEVAALRAQRRRTRQQRQQADAAWRAQRQPRRPTRAQRARDEQWRAQRAQRQAELEQRQQEDARWRQQRHQQRERLNLLPLITAWIAILVITDNCSRQCVGLPLFVAGPKVTAEMVVAALRVLLPPELHFLISDRGTHFTAQVFRQFALNQDFIHVLIARHRPESNGIAERFVRTLKHWLADKEWHTDQQLAELLAQFLAEYNDRPHQGLALPGLSPNEFARRIGVL